MSSNRAKLARLFREIRADFESEGWHELDFPLSLGLDIGARFLVIQLQLSNSNPCFYINANPQKLEFAPHFPGGREFRRLIAPLMQQVEFDDRWSINSQLSDIRPAVHEFVESVRSEHRPR